MRQRLAGQDRRRRIRGHPLRPPPGKLRGDGHTLGEITQAPDIWRLRHGLNLPLGFGVRARVLRRRTHMKLTYVVSGGTAGPNRPPSPSA